MIQKFQPFKSFPTIPVLAVLALVFQMNMSVFSHAAEYSRPYIVIDMDDGAILASHRETDRWYPASLTKLMSAYVTMESIRNGDVHPGSPVIISRRARNMPPSKMGYKIGTKLRVDTALKIVIVKSANDVSVALAEAIGGSVENFVSMMNQSAHSMGLTTTNFTNSNGLHSPNQYSSARDMAVLARRIRIDFPQYAEIFATPAIKSGKKTYYSYNLLLERYSGSNGMKTGFVCASGYNLIASATRNNRNLIAVVMGADSQTERAILAAKLLTNAFTNKDIVIGNLLSPVMVSTRPAVNMRKNICSENARKLRYDPGAGQAVIKSKWLQPRIKCGKSLHIATGGIDASASKLYLSQLSIPKGKIPVPVIRPAFEPPVPIDAKWLTANKLRNTIAVPVSRPSY